jgi:hypothetical protein
VIFNNVNEHNHRIPSRAVTVTPSKKKPLSPASGETDQAH